VNEKSSKKEVLKPCSVPYSLKDSELLVAQGQGTALDFLLRSVLLGLNPRFYAAFRPLALSIQAIPVISWLGFAVFALGIGWRALVLIADRLLLLGGEPTRILREVLAPPLSRRSYFSPEVVEVEAEVLRFLASSSRRGSGGLSD